MTCPTCNTPIAEHPAGACMDALVATRVMGLRVTPHCYRWTGNIVPAYSTDPAGMVELWDKLRGPHKSATINADGGGFWTVTIRTHEHPDGYQMHVIRDPAPTPMLALARAAVLAVAATEGRV